MSAHRIIWAKPIFSLSLPHERRQRCQGCGGLLWMAAQGRSISYRLRVVIGGSLCALSRAEAVGVVAAHACGDGSAGKN